MGDHVCPWWLAYTFDNPLRALFHKPDHLFSSFIKPGMTVADIGCGLGYFSIGMAKLVGENGKVLAVDIQEKMLEKMEKRSRRRGFGETIHPIQCSESDISISEPLDFALTFWMAHETPNVESFLGQIHKVLKPGGYYYITEPKFHVSADDYKREMDLAAKVGFVIKEEPSVNFSYASVLQRSDG